MPKRGKTVRPAERRKIEELLQTRNPPRTVARLVKRSLSLIYRIRRELEAGASPALDGTLSRHQEELLGVLEQTRLLVDRFTPARTFPTVWETPIASGPHQSGIEVVDEGGRWLWRMPWEETETWSRLVQHLQTRRRETSPALTDWATIGGDYSRLLQTVCDTYQTLVEKARAAEKKPVQLNSSEFYRRILEELDINRPHDPYPTTPFQGRWEVAFRGVWLLTASTQDQAARWTTGHKQWRRRFRRSREHRQLQELRGQLQSLAKEMSALAIEAQRQNRVSGRCDVCHPWIS